MHQSACCYHFSMYSPHWRNKSVYSVVPREYISCALSWLIVYPAIAFLQSRRWIDIDSRRVLGPCKRSVFVAFLALFGMLLFSTVDWETNLVSTPVLALCKRGFYSFVKYRGAKVEYWVIGMVVGMDLSKYLYKYVVGLLDLVYPDFAFKWINSNSYLCLMGDWIVHLCDLIKVHMFLVYNFLQ